MHYVKRHDGSIVQTFTEADDGIDRTVSIPPDPANRDYAEFLEWEAEQGAPLEPEPEPAPDPSIQVGETLRTRARDAIDANKAFLAKASPTNADVLAQVKALTRQQNAVVRLLIGALDSAD